jgi:hypothetical protein
MKTKYVVCKTISDTSNNLKKFRKYLENIHGKQDIKELKKIAMLSSELMFRKKVLKQRTKKFHLAGTTYFQHSVAVTS